MNYYERHIGDYLKDTAHLSLLEHGIYGRLLDIYYSRESGIPIAQVGRLVGARTDEEQAALASVLQEFFVSSQDAWTHRRCEAEIARYVDKQRKAKASANARWSNTERNAAAMPTHSEGNAPSLQTPDPVTKEKEKPARASRKTGLPLDFSMSDGVKDWAAERGIPPAVRLANFEAFVSYAKRKDARYADWDEALKTAIRDDWAKAQAAPATETNYARSMREKYEQITPLIAAKAPGAPRANPMDVIEGMVREPKLIAG